jgi:hypothetical protein
MRIDCKHVWEHISAYIDGEVDAELRAEIDKHLETCEICSAVLDSTRNVVVLMADDRVFELPAGFSERLHAGWTGNWNWQKICFSVLECGGGGPVRCTIGCVHVSSPTRISVTIASATCSRSERRSFLLISRLRHCAEGRDRKCQIQASTARFTIAPTAARISMGMRIAS